LNDQEATALWYHDHAMDITRFTVMSGLLGMYLIRDKEEDALNLPDGKYEVPLIICDRNLNTDSQGKLTGELLFKIPAITEASPIPAMPPIRTLFMFVGPYTLVNGVIWPHFKVETRWYRFRVLNASHNRSYKLFLIDEQNVSVKGAIKQIGTDSGLLGAALPIDEGLTLAPAERADILINFSAFRGKNLRLVNTGREPAGIPESHPLFKHILLGQTDPENGLVEPDVMQFRVSSKTFHDHSNSRPSCHRPSPALPTMICRTITRTGGS